MVTSRATIVDRVYMTMPMVSDKFSIVGLSDALWHCHVNTINNRCFAGYHANAINSVA
jgi:hypothetical protein